MKSNQYETVSGRYASSTASWPHLSSLLYNTQMPIDHAHQECWTCLFNTNSNEPLHIPGLQIEPVHPENWGSYTEDGMHPSFGSLEVQCRKTIVKRNLKQKINGLYTRICKLFKKEEK